MVQDRFQRGQFVAAFRGFGEAASAFSKGFERQTLASLSAFDEKTALATERDAVLERCRTLDVTAQADPEAAFTGADLVISLVYADRAVEAARDTAGYLSQGALYIDGNSCSPQSKLAAADAMIKKGVDYVDMAIMAPVYPKMEKTPVLLSGPLAERAAGILEGLGMVPRVAGKNVGQASTIKLTRSIMVKGLEALCAECFLTARLGGVEEEIIASLEASDAGFDWRKRRDYAMDRMTTHGRRRAAEMEEAASMIEGFGLDNAMARATVKWERRLGELPFETQDIELVLSALRGAKS